MKIDVEHQNSLLAIIVKDSYSEPGVTFFTEKSLSQQLAYMKHPLGKVIQPHSHKPVKREVHFTQEVLIIKRGLLRVDFYDEDNAYIKSYLLEKGDVILLISGGHGFEVIEEVEMVEVKQGPYAGTDDKILFDPISKDLTRLM